jgi:hypothetical protein
VSPGNVFYKANRTINFLEGTPMIGKYFSPLSGSTRTLLAALATSAIFVTGCSNMASSAPEVNPFTSAATLKGFVHGGNQPVSGATVSLYYVGHPPVLPQLAATTTTSNDGTGSFSFVQDPTEGNAADNGSTDTFSCPADGSSPLVYVIAKGGNTLNDGDATKNNTAAAFIAIFGNCNSLTSANQVYMSEPTTVATMAAVSQFFNPATDSISADGTGSQKLIINQLPATIALLASSATGNAVTTTAVSAPAKGANINPAVAVVATPESGKVNLLANIISSCINNASSTATQCGSLFSAAVAPIPNTTNLNPSSFLTATDTLQALYYMFTNPASTTTSNTGNGNITTLFGLAGAAGAPYQPYLNTQPTDWTIAISYASANASTCGTPTGGSGNFINSPVDLAIDASDNVWFVNSQGTLGNLSEIAAGGVPMTCVLPGTGAVGGTVIDSASNVWVGTTNGMVRYNPVTDASLTFATASTNPVALGADGAGNVYFSGVNGSTGSLYQLPSAATAATSTATQISSTVGPNPIRIKPDYSANGVLNNIWVTSGSSFVSQVAAGTGTGSVNGFVTTPHTTDTNSYGLSITHGGNVYIADGSTNSVTQFALANGSYSTPTGWPFAGAAAGINGPTGISIDPRSNTWIANNTNGTATGSVSVITNRPSATSPSSGFQKQPLFLNSELALAIDQAGNVWTVGRNGYITEIVGAAVPIYQPYAVGLANGRFQTIP